MARIITICGLFWGDEGKGRVSFELSEYAHAVVRAQGGANAGHTIFFEDKPLVFHLLPSGMVYPGKVGIVGPAVFVDPVVLSGEIEALRKHRPLTPEELVVDFRAPVVLKAYKEEDRIKGARIGTTGRGIGPAAARFWARESITLEEFCRKHPEGPCRVVKPFIGDSIETLWKLAEREVTILIEGAQGVLLDLVFGTYPYVTSSLTGCGGLNYLAGLGSVSPDSVGVTKAYVTRVGGGPFPTEIKDELGERLRQAGKEYGATTGRPRRCGWLDLPALAYAVRVSGVSKIVLTKIDVLSRLGRFRVATAYLRGSKRIPIARREDFFDPEVRLEYEEFSAGPPSPDAPWVKKLIHLIEDHCNVTVIGVTYGPQRKQSLYFRKSV